MALPSTPRHAPPTSGGVNIEAWAESATASLDALTISTLTPSPRAVRGTSVTIDIPLDADQQNPAPRRSDTRTEANEEEEPASTRSPYQRRREPIRRDSLKRREALLKGKEGSRRRQKWENDRLIGNPWMQPPEPHDWEPRPVHPVQSVPYFLAPLWDARQARAKLQEAREKAARAEQKPQPAAPADKGVTDVPKELKAKLKRSKGAKWLLRDLEEQVRAFVRMWEEKERELAVERKASGLDDTRLSDSEDEEIVFVGRDGQMRDMPTPRMSEESLERDKLVFDSLVDDHGASFGRWLVHTIAAYYNLRTWSITKGNPARREAYVGITDEGVRGGCKSPTESALPRPLWGLV